MAHDAGPAPTSGKLVVRNIGVLLSGDLAQPVLDADTVVAVDGRIAAIGRAKDLDCENATTIVDAHGCGLAPGSSTATSIPWRAIGHRGRASSIGSSPRCTAASRR